MEHTRSDDNGHMRKRQNDLPWLHLDSILNKESRIRESARINKKAVSAIALKFMDLKPQHLTEIRDSQDT